MSSQPAVPYMPISYSRGLTHCSPCNDSKPYSTRLFKLATIQKKKHYNFVEELFLQGFTSSLNTASSQLGKINEKKGTMTARV